MAPAHVTTHPLHTKTSSPPANPVSRSALHKTTKPSR